jgi:hypothetical protein
MMTPPALFRQQLRLALLPTALKQRLVEASAAEVDSNQSRVKFLRRVDMYTYNAIKSKKPEYRSSPRNRTEGLCVVAGD